MTYREAIQYLYGLQLFGASFGLDSTRALAAALGNPQDQLRFIHVAGTNGKGSTCAFLENIYRAAGLRVGLYTSPHLVSFRERVQINRQLIPEEDVARLVDALGQQVMKLSGVPAPTFFEVITVLALKYFAEQQCDLVIWETGLGGRLDATNIVTPLASVITNVELDHETWLGDTVAKIAVEKAGIIKPGVPVFTTLGIGPALDVITHETRAQNTALTLVGAEPFALNCPLGLGGQHQQTNAALAAAVVEGLQPEIPVAADTIRRGLKSAVWPGRLQSVLLPDGREVLLDGAHNPSAARALVTALDLLVPGKDVTLVLGILRDKNWKEICRILAPVARHIILCRVGSDRSTEPEALRKACEKANADARFSIARSITEALQQAAEARKIVITGSLYLIGEALAALGMAPSDGVAEMSLNDWTPRVKN